MLYFAIILNNIVLIYSVPNWNFMLPMSYVLYLISLTFIFYMSIFLSKSRCEQPWSHQAPYIRLLNFNSLQPFISRPTQLFGLILYFMLLFQICLNASLLTLHPLWDPKFKQNLKISLLGYVEFTEHLIFHVPFL